MQHLLSVLTRLVFSIVCACALTMAVMLLVPGNPLFSIADRGWEAGQMESLRRSDLETLSGRLDFLVQKVVFLNFGQSRVTGEDIGQELYTRLGLTLQLAVLSTCIMVCTGVALAFVSGMTVNRWLDRVLLWICALVLATPAFWFGIVLMVVFGFWLGWFPISGAGHGTGLVLPALTVSLRPAAFLYRMLRSSLLEELKKPYVMVARAKGLSNIRVTGWHVLRNLTGPIISITGLELSQLLTGAVVAETLFSLKGLGGYIVSGIESRDYDIILVCVLVSVLMVCVCAAMTELLVHWADPRRRLA